MIDKHFITATGTLGEKLLKFMLRLVFLGGFDGAWYLIATILSVLIVYGLSRKLKNSQMFVISFILYAFAVLSGTYLHLFDGTILGETFYFFNVTISIPLFRTFFHGTIFILIGKIFAEKEELFNKKTTIILLIVLPFLMYGELLLTNYYGFNFATDCFFMLVPFSIVLFQFVLLYEIKPKKYHLLLRNSSTFIYMFHFIFLYVLYRLANAFSWMIFTNSIPVIITVYVVVILLSILLGWIVKKMSKKIKVLSYAL